MKRLLALVVALAMVLSLLPMSVLASESDSSAEPEVTAVEEAPKAEPVEETVVDTTEPAEESKAEEETPAEEEKPAEETPAEEAPAEETSKQEETPAEEAPAEETPAEDASEEKAPEQETAVSYPAQTFQGKDNGVTVDVTAPEGAFPEGTEMKVTPVAMDDVQDAVQDVVEGNVIDIVAVDISFFLGEKEIEPAKEIQVALAVEKLAEGDNYSVVHVDDDNNATVLEDEQIVEEADQNGATFTSDQFSIYLIATHDAEGDEDVKTPRITYHFLNEDGTPYKFLNKAGEEVDTQIVKNGESLQDVGSPVTGINKSFTGWYVAEKSGGSYSVKTPAEQVLFDTAITVTEDADVYVMPVYGDAYVVTFYDKPQGSEDSHILTKRLVPVTNGSATVRVDNVSVPTTSTTVLTAWTLNGTDHPIATEKTLTISSDVSLYPVFSEGHWLRFVSGESGSGAEYVSGIFVTANTQVSDLTSLPTTTREGFNFSGWYRGSMTDGKITYDTQVSNASGTVPNANAQTLLNDLQSGDVYLYGNWTGNQVNYRVAIWYENADDDGYSFQSVSTRTGTAGTETNVTASSVSGFTAQAIEQKTIKGDGSTVINVYYKRNEYSIRFYNRNQEITALRITAKYGADIHLLWPGVREGTTDYSALWQIRDGDKLVSGASTMPLNGANYTRLSDGNYYINTVLMVQNIDGTNTFTQYVDRPFSYSSHLSVGVEEFTAIDGFSVNANSASDAQSIRNGAANYGSDPNATYNTSFNRSPAVNSNTRYAQRVLKNGRYYYTYYFYYLRNQYNVIFEENGGPAVNDLTGIYYEANIATSAASGIAAVNNSYKVGETTKTVPGEGTYVFQGWYDNDSYFGDPFDFNTNMPAGNVTLYAKWERVWYLMQIDPNGGEISAQNEATYTWLQYGDHLREYNIQRNFVEDPNGDYYYYSLLYDNDPDGNISSSVRKAYYVKVSEATAEQLKHIDTSVKYKEATTLDNYSLLGWYNRATGAMYDFGAPITGPTSIYAVWRRSGTYDIRYNPVMKDGTTTVSGTITNEIDAGYADKSETMILNTPTSITATNSAESGSTPRYVFKGWQIVSSFGDDQTVLDEKIYKQGDDFTVDADLANSEHIIFMQAVYETTEASEEPVPVTTVTYHANMDNVTLSVDGVDEAGADVPKVYQLNARIDLNTEVTVSSGVDGYELVGWATSANAKTAEFKVDDIIGADNEEPLPNDLYAVWEAYFYVYHSSTAEKTKHKMVETFDITSQVAKGYLYGGYYSDYAGKGTPYTGATSSWDSSKAYTEKGTEMKPAAGTTYYLKEVPEAYAQASNFEIWHTKTDVLKQFYLVSTIDDANYKAVGFKVGLTKTDLKSTLTKTFVVDYTDPDQPNDFYKDELTADKFNNVPAGLIAYTVKNTILTPGKSVTYRPYYTTLDGVTVFGKLQRTAKSNKNDNPVHHDKIIIESKKFN